MRSSAKSKWETLRLEWRNFPRELEFTLSSKVQEKAFITITNRSGERGSPCRRPQEELKKPFGLPLTKTENEADLTHWRTRLI
ncbi:hypothetical protein QJS04_geneDACA014819 [Acorus gramineus]|uniref:Uncharacterized protein n=1 Tax=Acorus gramineus TaxID=55184 RepID=A0AAV9BRL4_ACOGR|nr:hypothetical protein QJS04_geneDACA014819 [Acorus gramineus]